MGKSPLEGSHIPGVYQQEQGCREQVANKLDLRHSTNPGRVPGNQ